QEHPAEPPPDAAPPEPAPAVLDVMTRPAVPPALVVVLPPALSPAHFGEEPAGTYYMRVEPKCYDTLAPTVVLNARPPRPVDLALDPLPSGRERKKTNERRHAPPRDGILKARTRPYSEVYLGSRRLGQTPLVVDLDPGSYTLTFKHPGKKPIKRRVTIKPGQTTKLDFSL